MSDRTKPCSPAEQAAIYEKFWKAAENGQLVRVRRLIEQGADVGYTQHACTALHQAAEHGHAPIIDVLIEEGGADLNELCVIDG